MTTVPEEAVKAALAHYSEGGCMGLDEHERREVTVDMLTAALPHLPGVGVKKLEDWQLDQILTGVKSQINHNGWEEPYVRNRLRFELERILSALEPSAARKLALEEAHADDVAVDRFAVAMKEKLAKKRAEGRGGWENKDECSAEYLSYLLIQHIWKGDPVDIANLAMMLQQRGERVVIDSETSSIIPDHADAGKVEGDGWVPSEYEVYCDDEWVAASNDLREAMNYAANNAGDGVIELVEVRRRTLPSAPSQEVAGS